jgi:ATP-dependent RNA helicase DDX52/ROK1
MSRPSTSASRNTDAANRSPAASASASAADMAALPAQLDFFRQQQSASVAPCFGVRAPKRPRAPADSNTDASSSESDSDDELDATALEEDALVAELSPDIGSECVARGMVRMGAGVRTKVQERGMRLVANGDVHVVAVAPTGSGKTLAYTAPIIACIVKLQEAVSNAIAAEKEAIAETGKKQGGRRKKCRSEPPTAPSSGVQRKDKRAPICLVLVPTRELAVQVGAVFTRLADECRAPRVKLNVSVVASKAALAGLGGANVDVVVATPQRCAVALERKLLDLSRVKHVVLDEADRLLDDGFISQVDAVLAACGNMDKPGAPLTYKLHAFSATMPSATEDIIRGLAGKDKVTKVVVGGGSYGGSAAVADVADSISQKFMFVGGRGEQGKVLAVRGMIKDGLQPPVLLFVQSKERAADLFRELIYDGIDVDAIHADRSGAARSSAIARFRAGRLSVLIATDILARGLDFRAVATVVNYDMPTSASAYVHRIGRTGRNGRSGAAITLFTEEDSDLLRAVAGVAKASGAEVPAFFFSQKKHRRDEIARLETRPPARRRVGGSSAASLHSRPSTARMPGKKRPDKRKNQRGVAPDEDGCKGSA